MSHCKVINGLLTRGALQLDNLPVFDETRLEIEQSYSFISRINCTVEKTLHVNLDLSISFQLRRSVLLGSLSNRVGPSTTFITQTLRMEFNVAEMLIVHDE
jgi:hypothetical protein